MTRKYALRASLPLLFRLCTLTALLLLASPGCRRAESQAADPEPPDLSGIQLQERTFKELGTFYLPAGWHVRQGQYPSKYGEQFYYMVRARLDRDDEDKGLLSIDVSPSHPRLWRKKLPDHVASRLKALGAIGPTEASAREEVTAALPYEAEELFVRVNGELGTVFRIFRQKSRVVTVAVTASLEQFDLADSARLVDQVSSRLILHLPIVQFQKPDLSVTQVRTIGNALTVEVPKGWRVIRHREEQSIIPAETFELTPPNPDLADDPPTLNLALVRVSQLGPDVEIEAVAVPSGGGDLRGERQASATVFHVDEDTLGAARMIRVGGDLLTVTYAAPDYLFELKAALALLERIAQSVSLTAGP